MAASVRRGLYTRQIASTCACRLLKAGRPSERSVRREGFWRTAPSGDEIAVLKDALEKIRKEEKKKLAEEIRKEEKKKLAEEVRKEEQEKYEESVRIFMVFCGFYVLHMAWRMYNALNGRL
ncbi:hypothetical protein HXX76_000850 [Chlamydomonas incerta]|uniref:Uncharacterized protein n=1 Tax=Chlamydomonas incerta TaxID=51695 RepID=A0A836B3E5_CHLIN|nr:hypothetical protein HXX76_000850 [Chlamydomonas incerta]|eukprot:KAG2446258.1 hypothetical protein HXX76_000850 [Chlamydomonas incerta]